MINIVEVPLIEIRGQGRSTGKLIDITEQIVKNAKNNVSECLYNYFNTVVYIAI